MSFEFVPLSVYFNRVSLRFSAARSSRNRGKSLKEIKRDRQRRERERRNERKGKEKEEEGKKEQDTREKNRGKRGKNRAKRHNGRLVNRRRAGKRGRGNRVSQSGGESVARKFPR